MTLKTHSSPKTLPDDVAGIEHLKYFTLLDMYEKGAIPHKGYHVLALLFSGR